MNDLRALISGALMDGGSEEDEANNLLAATLAASQAEAAARSGESAANEGQQQQQQQLQIDLSTAVNSDSLNYLLQDEEFLRLVESHLPPVAAEERQPGEAAARQTPSSSEQLKKQFGETVRSSQFRLSLRQFCMALQSGQLGPLMSQFGLNQACVDAASLGNLEAFMRALDAQAKSGSAASGTGTGTGSGSASSTTTSSSAADQKQQPPPSGEAPKSDKS